MKKKIFIGLGVLVIALAAFGAYEAFIVAKRSPQTTATYNDQGLDIKVVYCQPSKRGRVIFGEEKDGALQPYGKYWRLGANAATEITFNKDVTFGGQPLHAGTYRMYAVPGADAFKVYLNSELGVNYSAANEPNHTLDVLTVDAPVQKPASQSELFNISFRPDSTGVNIDLAWDETLFSVPVTVQ